MSAGSCVQQKLAISLKRRSTRRMSLLIFTNMKLHNTGFRMTSRSTTLDDLGRSLRILQFLLHRTYIPRSQSKRIDQYCRRQNCSPRILLCILRLSRQNDCRIARFPCDSTAFLCNVCMYAVLSCRIVFQIHWSLYYLHIISCFLTAAVVLLEVIYVVVSVNAE